jgi:hypothetical protein
VGGVTIGQYLRGERTRRTTGVLFDGGDI